MDTKFGIRLLDVLVENCSRILAQGFGVNWAESAFFDVVRLLRQNEALKEYFLLKVEATFELRVPNQPSSGAIPFELIELIAHELRWPQILELAQGRVDKFFNDNHALAPNDIALRLSKAYEDNWSGREVYEHYQKHTLPSQIITV